MLGAFAAQGDQADAAGADEPEYRQFTDRLLEIYYQACRVQPMALRAAGRTSKVAALDEEIFELYEACGPWSCRRCRMVLKTTIVC